MTGLVSGEGVAIDLSRAGLGSRILAAAIDLGAQLLAVLIVIIVDGLVGASDPDIATALILIELVLIFAGYPILCEWLGRGKTLGKLAMGLRVVRDDGGPIAFRQALVRGLAGFLLEKPGIFLPPLCTAAGMFVLGTSKSSKRIGDMMAGTFVVTERAGPRSALASIPLFVPPALYGWAQALDLSGVDDRLALQLRQFVFRAAEMSSPARDMLGAQFRARIQAVISPQPPPGVPTPVLLTTVLAERRRRADLAAASAAFAQQRDQPNQPQAYSPNGYPPSQWHPPSEWQGRDTDQQPRGYQPPTRVADDANPFKPPS